MPDEALLDEAVAWVEDDPDASTRAELRALVDAGKAGDEAALADLRSRFNGFLEFGTAGLRGRLGAGPSRMNRVVVIRAAAGLVTYLQEALGRLDVTVVIGYDARHNSDVFARDTASVVTAAGGRALVLPRPLPTPVLAFAIRDLGADAGVMVTASHNPATDNGYKVYLGDGSQIVPPIDAQIAKAISRFPTGGSVPQAASGWQVMDDDVEQYYVEAAAASINSDTARDVSVVHTALHGVGAAVFAAAFESAGFANPVAVAEQAQPDPDFPTVAFPNPEEPGAIDAAVKLARQVQPDLVIASDPDADRCAVAVPDPTYATSDDPAGWRMLRGDELGVLLGHRAIEAIVKSRQGSPHDERLGAGFTPSTEGVVANSIVSSRQLGVMAKANSVEHVETLTGFKWISRVPGLVYGYEEALGYCTAPAVARDKDGITAGLAIAELAAELKQKGRSLLDVLDELAAKHGVFATDAFSVRVDDLSDSARLMTALRQHQPSSLANVLVAEFTDLADSDGELPPTDGLRFLLDDDSRVIVRPSGTEPKVKVYLEVIVPAIDGGLAAARREADERLRRLRGACEAMMGMPR